MPPSRAEARRPAFLKPARRMHPRGCSAQTRRTLSQRIGRPHRGMLRIDDAASPPRVVLWIVWSRVVQSKSRMRDLMPVHRIGIARPAFAPSSRPRHRRWCRRRAQATFDFSAVPLLRLVFVISHSVIKRSSRFQLGQGSWQRGRLAPGPIRYTPILIEGCRCVLLS